MIRVPERPYPERISMKHSGGVRVNTTGSAVLVLESQASLGLEVVLVLYALLTDKDRIGRVHESTMFQSYK